jgi:hypothetical protein
MRIEQHLPLTRRLLRKRPSAIVLVHARVGRIDAFELRIYLFESAKHLVEGVILQGEKDDVLDRIAARLVWFRHEGASRLRDSTATLLARIGAAVYRNTPRSHLGACRYNVLRYSTNCQRCSSVSLSVP